MTNTEINEAVARKLGYERVGANVAAFGGGSMWKTPDRKLIVDELNMDYCHSIAAAWEIVEFCKNDIKMASDFQWELLEVTNSSDDSFEIFDITPMSICQAFLKLP